MGGALSKASAFSVQSLDTFLETKKRTMSHPFGDLLSQHLRRKHGLNQSRLAEGILQDPTIIGKMCKGQRLNGPQARERVCAIIDWLRAQNVLSSVSEANGLLAAAGMAPLRSDLPAEQALLAQLTPPAASPPLSAPPPPRRTNLPAPLTSFIGRAQEVAEVGHLIVHKRLVTLTGVGGVGKTRLASEVAKALVTAPVKNATNGLPQPFPDGIWLVELAALTTPGAHAALDIGLLVQTIMRILKRPEQAGSTTVDGLQEYLADKQLLLVLDNCEHLVAACAALSEGLLHHCWGLHILATSREELRVPGETLYPVLPLALPGATENGPAQVLASAAAQLLVDRVRATQPRFQLADAEIVTLAHICRRLDGIPLALELAAPLTRSLSLAEIASQLDNQMALLTNGYRTAIPRHQTMHSALVWSYRLLAPDEQRLLARVAVFAGGWTVAAAKAVCADEADLPVTDAAIARLHNQLIAQSLVLVETQQGERRYRLLEPVRQFATLQLKAQDEQPIIQRRHADYFLALAEKLEQVRDTPHEQEWLERLEPERDNLRAVNLWAFEQKEAEFAQRFNGLLFAFWGYRSNMAETRHWLEGALALTQSQQGGTRTTAARIAEAAALNLAGHVTALSNDFDQARLWFERELQLRRELADPKGTANALRGISFALMLSNTNLDQAQHYVEQALTICYAAKDEWGIAWSLFDLGHIAFTRNDLAAAQKWLAEATPLFRTQGNNFGLFNALLISGHHRCKIGDKEQARRFYTEALHLQQQMHYWLHIADGLEGLGALTADQNPRHAVQLFGAAHAHRQASALHRPHHQAASYEVAVALTRKQLAPEAWESAWSAGCSLHLEEAVAYALAVEG